MKPYEAINWYEKNADDVYDYLFENLENDVKEQSIFLQWLMQWFPEMNIDWIDIFEDFSDELIRTNKVQDVLNFVSWYKEKYPENYLEKYEFIEQDLSNYFFYTKDIEQIKARIAIVQQNPVSGIETFTIRLLYQLIYHGYYELAISYANSIWKPIVDSDKLYGFPAYPLISTIHVSLLQNFYEENLKGNQTNEDELFKQLVTLGFEDDKSILNRSLQYLKEEFSITAIEESIQNDDNEFFLILNIHFLKYMYHTYQLPFIFSERIWNFVSSTELFGKEKGIENWFNVHSKILDKYFWDNLDIHLGSNELEIFGQVWGLEYVFTFLHKYGLLSTEHYEKMIAKITYLRNAMIRYSNSNLWHMLFVFDWPKTNNFAEDPTEKSLFNDTFGIDSSISSKNVETYLSHKTPPEWLKWELNHKNSKPKNKILPGLDFMPIVKNEPSIGRNDLCPCGSGKKYKKCCMDN